MTGILWRHHLNSKKQFSFQYCKTKKNKKIMFVFAGEKQRHLDKSSGN